MARQLAAHGILVAAARALLGGLVCGVLTCQHVFGLAPTRSLTQYHYDGWTIDQGLPQNSVKAVVQTPDGYLWVGTYEGLARFDGVSFHVYRSGVVEGFEPDVTALVVDGDGALWIGTEATGVWRLRGRELAGWGTADGLLSNAVRAVAVGGEGSVWVGTSAGLNRLRDGDIEAFHVAPSVSSLVAAGDGSLWIGSNGGGLMHLRDDELKGYTVADGLCDDRVLGLHEGAGGAIWISTLTGGLCRLHEGRFTTYTTRDGLPSNVIRCVEGDRDGNLWVATDASGLARLRDGVFETVSVADGLTSNSVRSLCEDREGGLWVGTNGGLNRLRRGKFTTYSSRDGLAGDFVRVVMEDGNGAMWIGTDDGGLSVFANERFTSLGETHEIFGSAARTVWVEDSGTAWIGVYGHGVVRLDGDRMQILTAADGLSSQFVRALFVDREGRLWVGTDDGLDCLSGGEVTVSTSRDGLVDDRVRAIFEDSRGDLWIGTRGGVNVIRGGVITALPGGGVGANNTTFAFHEDAAGVMWIGTRYGLFRLEKQSLFHYAAALGFFENAVFQILEDDAGDLWMGTNHGIVRARKSELEDLAAGRVASGSVIRYEKADGMVSQQCNGNSQPAGWKANDGRLWFPTAAGLVVVDPERVPINEVPAPVLVEQVVTEHEAMVFEPPAVTQVPAGTKKFELHYSGLSLLAPERVRFKYRLEGQDPQWIDAGTRRVAYYTNLQPGAYRFRVLACNSDGVWNEEGASVGFYLKPYLYQTRTFKLSVALLVLGCLYGAYRARVVHLKRRTQQLEQTVHERTRDIRRQAAELETMDRIVRVINSQVALEPLLQSILEQGKELFPQAEMGIFLVRSWSSGRFRAAAVFGYPSALTQYDELEEDKALSLFAGDASQDEEGVYLLCRDDGDVPEAGRLGFPYGRASLTLPVRVDNRLEGFVAFFNQSDAEAFRASDARNLRRLGGHAESAISKARMLRELEVRNQFIRKTFGRYLSDEVVAGLLASPEGPELGGELRRVTILMSDLRGFSSVAEGLGPSQVLDLLNNYLGHMADVIMHHDGTIDEFIGDGILAIFGAPVTRDDDADRAVACAAAMQMAIPEVNERNREQGLPAVEMGVAVNTGDVVVGNIGSHKRTKYGVVGSQVNLTGRIESYTVGGQVLVSESTARACKVGLRTEGAPLTVRAKGIQEPVQVLRLTGIGEPYDLDLPDRRVELTELGRAVPVSYAVIKGKQVSETGCGARLTEISRDGAVLVTEAELALYEDLKLVIPAGDGGCEVYAKVVERRGEDGRRPVLRFTSTPAGFAEVVARLLGEA